MMNNNDILFSLFLALVCIDTMKMILHDEDIYIYIYYIGIVIIL